MNDSSGVQKVNFRRNFQNLPKQGQKKKKKKDAEEEKNDESLERKAPLPPDGSSTIDLTA